MRRGRIALGIALVLLVTILAVGFVATSAAITLELSDGDGCETGSTSDVTATDTPTNVTALAGNVTECIAEDNGSDAADRNSNARNGPPAGSDLDR